MRKRRIALELVSLRGRDERRGAPAIERGDISEAGELVVVSPLLLRLEIVNVAGRRWGWQEPALLELVTALDDLDLVARWTARGLTAYDATYVALAEARRSGS